MRSDADFLSGRPTTTVFPGAWRLVKWMGCGHVRPVTCGRTSLKFDPARDKCHECRKREAKP